MCQLWLAKRIMGNTADLDYNNYSYIKYNSTIWNLASADIFFVLRTIICKLMIRCLFRIFLNLF